MDANFPDSPWGAETLRELLDCLKRNGPRTIVHAGPYRRYVFDGNGSFAKIETACLAAGDGFTFAGVERLFAKVASSSGRTLPDMLDLDLEAAAAALDTASLGGPQAAADDSPWVLSSPEIWRPRFKSNKELTKFRKQHPEMFDNPSGNRLKIHAAKWAAYWATRDKAGFESLDGELQSVADDPDVQEGTLAGMMERAAAIRAKKKAGKQ